MHDDAAWKRVRMRVRSNERERSRWIALAQVVTNYGGLSSGPLFPRGKGALVALAMARRRKRILLDVVFGADDQVKGRKDEDNGYEGQYVGHWHYLVLR